MPLLTTVIDDKSPLISYDATWLPGSSLDDNLAIDYYLGTFQKNSAADGTATISFNATSFWIYGANRPNHGAYTIQVDGNSFPNFNGSGNNLFQQTLYNTNTDQGMHTVKLINTGGTTGLYVDIDMIVWQSEVGNPGDQLVPELVQDGDSRFQYQSSGWSTTSSSSNINLNLFNNGTGHLATSSAATVSFTFIGMSTMSYSTSSCCILTILTGEAVTLFGASGPSSGLYSIQLDGAQGVQYNATSLYPTNYGVVIYHADNLGPGQHQIMLTNLPATSQQYLAIDYAQVWTVANSSSTSSSSASPSVTPCTPQPSGNSNNNDLAQNKVSSGAIAGLVVEGVVAVLAAVLAFIFYRRWRAALDSAYTAYTPLHRSPGTTTATATATAPSVETRSHLSSSQNNAFQSFATIGRVPQQGDSSTLRDNISSHMTSPSADSRILATGPVPTGKAANEVYTPVRPLPDTPGESQRSRFDDGNGSVLPGYDTVVHSNRM